MSFHATVYLIPSPLADGALQAIPSYILDAVKSCRVFFVENERSARRYLKSIWKEMVIDDYEWIVADKDSDENSPAARSFRSKMKEGVIAGIISEAGCPGIADPGQVLVAIAHECGAKVKPLVGPSSILLALMASGFNGQRFQFVGYLPVDAAGRIKALKDLEKESLKEGCTQVFMETPYRNNQLLETIIRNCLPSTRLCIASNLTSPGENIQTKSINDWKKALPDLHKKPVMFCLMA